MFFFAAPACNKTDKGENAVMEFNYGLATRGATLKHAAVNMNLNSPMENVEPSPRSLHSLCSSEKRFFADIAVYDGQFPKWTAMNKQVRRVSRISGDSYLQH